MARTRAEIQTLVELNTGKSDKDSLMDSLCDSALKLAVMKHPFRDACHICDDEAITEDATSVDISALEESAVAIGKIVSIVTARIVEASGTMNTKLIMKQRQWWDKNIINPEDNQQGWPKFGLHFGSNVIIDRPCQSGLELRLRCSAIPTFASDSTECPIETLDLFVEQYVTAFVFLSLEEKETFAFWKSQALGPAWDKGVLGGTLLQAIQSDRSIADEMQMEGHKHASGENGLSVQNLITGSPNYGNTEMWY